MLLEAWRRFTPPLKTEKSADYFKKLLKVLQFLGGRDPLHLISDLICELIEVTIT
jgi:hypothetical protein